ncbi:hypothetical protein NBRC116594_27810 [Shimia sp. NS0008-38b]
MPRGLSAKRGSGDSLKLAFLRSGPTRRKLILPEKTHPVFLKYQIQVNSGNGKKTAAFPYRAKANGKCG